MARRSNDGPKQARIAFILSLWPFAFFVLFSGTTLLLFITMALNIESLRVAVWTLFGSFVYRTTISPAVAVPLLSNLFGTVMGFEIRKSGEDKETTKVATRAAILGSAGFALYAFLFWSWFGVGR